MGNSAKAKEKTAPQDRDRIIEILRPVAEYEVVWKKLLSVNMMPFVPKAGMKIITKTRIRNLYLKKTKIGKIITLKLVN